MKSCVCTGCGRTIEKEFAFCPWCGVENKEIEKHDYMDVIFQRYTNQHNEEKNRRINAMRSRLESLERDLDVLVLSAEMHR